MQCGCIEVFARAFDWTVHSPQLTGLEQSNTEYYMVKWLWQKKTLFGSLLVHTVWIYFVFRSMMLREVIYIYRERVKVYWSLPPNTLPPYPNIRVVEARKARSSYL